MNDFKSLDVALVEKRLGRLLGRERLSRRAADGAGPPSGEFDALSSVARAASLPYWAVSLRPSTVTCEGSWLWAAVPRAG